LVIHCRICRLVSVDWLGNGIYSRFEANSGNVSLSQRKCRYAQEESTMREYNLVSADSHIIEPPDLWERWLPKKYQDKAPKLVKDDEGGDAWQYRPGGAVEPL